MRHLQSSTSCDPDRGDLVRLPPADVSIRFVLFFGGEARVSLPDPNNEGGRLSGPEHEAWFPGGPNGLLIAADTTGPGHYTDYPSDQPTHALQIPTLDGRIPPHDIIRNGPCPANVAPGYRGGSLGLSSRRQVPKVGRNRVAQ